MGAKTSGNFWHIILGHGHCGGVGAQRIEINMITITKRAILIGMARMATAMTATTRATCPDPPLPDVNNRKRGAEVPLRLGPSSVVETHPR